MMFVDKLFQILVDGISFLGEMIWKVVEFISKPLTYLYYFLEGIFYFFYQVFNIAVKIIMIFVALFQFIIALISGIMRTIFNWLTFNVDTSYVYYPASSGTGLDTLLDVIAPTGLLTVVPIIATAIVWFFFVLRIIALLGTDVNIRMGVDR